MYTLEEAAEAVRAALDRSKKGKVMLGCDAPCCAVPSSEENYEGDE